MKKLGICLIAAVVLCSVSMPVSPHCEIPCGIYNDKMRCDMIEEHITTIEKSMAKIVELSKQTDKNDNQLVRWVTNKEKHAEYIQGIVYQYFMTQRIKPVDEKNQQEYKLYTKKLTLLHQMLIHSMKSKQTTDLTHVEKLRSLLKDFQKVYFGKELVSKN